MGFQERLGLLVDWEFTRRQYSRLQRLIHAAMFQDATACVEDIRYGDDRKLDRQLILELASYRYTPHSRNAVLVAPTGVGRSYLAQALGQSACRRFLSTWYVQLPDSLD